MKGIIVADDLTGANASGALVKKLGLSVCSLFSLQDAPEVDVLSYSTDSRGVAPQEAYRRVYDAFTRLGKGANFCNKRIDSTLRGNIGAEIDGALDALGEDYRAVVVPIYGQAESMNLATAASVCPSGSHRICPLGSRMRPGSRLPSGKRKPKTRISAA